MTSHRQISSLPGPSPHACRLRSNKTLQTGMRSSRVALHCKEAVGCPSVGTARRCQNCCCCDRLRDSARHCTMQNPLWLTTALPACRCDPPQKDTWTTNIPILPSWKEVTQPYLTVSKGRRALYLFINLPDLLLCFALQILDCHPGQHHAGGFVSTQREYIVWKSCRSCVPTGDGARANILVTKQSENDV